MENNTFKPWWWEFEQQKQVEAFENGGELKNIELSEEPSIIPTGAMHKDKNNLPEELGLTRKGIPVIQNVDDSAETLEDIVASKDDIIQSSEVEALEITFSKETTDFIEENRKKWEETKDPQIALEVGKRLTKEILFNTTDKSGLIDKIKEQV